MTRKDAPHPLSMLARRAHRTARRRRWTRRCVIALGLLAGVVVGGLYFGRGALTRGVALSRLEAALGYEATSEPAEILPGGWVSLPELALRTRDVPGEAGEVLRAQRVELDIDWVKAAFSPQEAVRSVRLIRPVFRASVNVETGALNLSGGGSGGGASPPSTLPPVAVEGARLVFGEHGGRGESAWFAPLHAIEISGWMRPEGGGAYGVSLSEGSNGGRTPASLEGTVDLDDGRGDFELRDVDFGALRFGGMNTPSASLLRRLSVDGRLPLATLSYQADGTYLVAADLTDVDVMAPAPILNPDAAGAPDQLLNLSGVTGRLEIDREGLHADFVGLFEDLDARVVIETAGLSAGADGSVEVIVSDYRLGPTPPLLPFAPALAAEFVQRFSGPAAVINGRVRVVQEDGAASASGLFAWREGSAAFEDFPYPISEISGRMTFDSSGVYVTDMRGVGPTGAPISAEVLAIPPGDEAEIGARIVAERAPLDEHLFNAIGGERGEVLAGLFSGEATRGIEPGGVVDLEIVVEKRGGRLGMWGWDVQATGEELGISVARLGYPLIARDFALDLNREHATAELPVLIGPTGLRGSARVEVPLRGSDGLPVTGEFVIEEASIDEVLMEALRARAAGVAEALGGRQVTGELSAAGTFEIPEDEATRLAGEARFQGIDLVGAEGERIASGLSGDVSFDRDEISARADGVGPGGSGVTLGARVEPGGGAWEASGEFAGMTFTDEALAGVSAAHEGAGARLASVVEEWGLGGSVDGALELRGGDEVDWVLSITRFDALTLGLGGERVAFENTGGDLRVDSDGVVFRDVRASVYADGGFVGEAAVNGRAPGGSLATVLTADAQRVRLESPVVRGLATKWASEAVRQAIAEADPAGAADVEVVVEQDASGDVAVRGRIEPERIELTRQGARASFSEATGAAVFDPSGFRFEELRLRAEGWDLLLDGAYDEAGGFAGEVDLTAREVNENLLASLPAEASGAAEAIGLEISEGGELWVSGSLGGGEDSELVIGFTGASFSLGAPVDRANGRLTIRRGADGAQLGDLELETFRAATVPMTQGRARLEWGEGGAVDVPTLTAECAGGVIRGRARLAATQGFGGGREFLVDVRCAGVPLAWIIERPEGEARPEDNLEARGVIAGRLRVRGPAEGGAEGRVGRGLFTITGGEVLRLPLLTPVFELMNLQAPVGERLNDAAIEFGVAGDTLVFDRLYVQSDSLVVAAAGEADLGAGTIDLAVRTRGRTRVPLVSDLIDAFKDELLGARITGAIADPQYSAAQLPRAGRLLLGAIAPGAGGRGEREAPPERPALVEHVPSTLEPIDE